MEYVMGDIIRRIREEKGISQGQLCEGICATSTLSRIENGCQAATRRTYDTLMGRLGQSGFLYENVSSFSEYELRRLEVKILFELSEKYIRERCLGSDNEKAFDGTVESLYAYKKLLDPNDERGERFLEFVKTAALYSENIYSSGVEREQIGQIIVERSKKAYGRGKIDLENLFCKDTLWDIIDIKILNLLAIGEYMRGNVQTALEIQIALYNFSKKYVDLRQEKNKRLAFICNNIAVLLSELSLTQEALIYAQKSIKWGADFTRICETYILLSTRSICYLKAGNVDEAYRDKCCQRQLLSLILSETNNCDNYESFENLSMSKMFLMPIL